MTASIKSQVKCNAPDHAGQYGGRSITKRFLLFKFSSTNDSAMIALAAKDFGIKN